MNPLLGLKPEVSGFWQIWNTSIATHSFAPQDYQAALRAAFNPGLKTGEAS